MTWMGWGTPLHQRVPPVRWGFFREKFCENFGGAPKTHFVFSYLDWFYPSKTSQDVLCGANRTILAFFRVFSTPQKTERNALCYALVLNRPF